MKTRELAKRTGHKSIAAVRAVYVGALAATAAACTTNVVNNSGAAAAAPTTEEALRRFLPPFCARVKECNPSGFDAAYKSEAECVEKGVAATPAETRAKTSGCTSSDIDTCVSDVKAATCDAITSGKVPTSCERC